MNQKKQVIYYLILSVTAAALIFVMSWFSSSNMKTIQMFDKLIVGGAFILSCISGIYLAIKPDWIKRIHRGSRGSQNLQTKVREIQGHHPDCEQFKSHTIKIKNKILCTGCNGLTLGSIISIFLTSIYIVYPNEIPAAILKTAIILGMFIIAISYIEMVIPVRVAYLHIISNAFLVISFFLITTGIFHLTGSIIYGLSGLTISFLWLDTRIQLSKWHHAEICLNCRETCKAY